MRRYRLTSQGEVVAEGYRRSVLLQGKEGPFEEHPLFVAYLDYTQKPSGPYPSLLKSTIRGRLVESGWPDFEVDALFEEWIGKGWIEEERKTNR